MKDRYHGFIIEHHPSAFSPYLVMPYTQKQIGGRKHYRYADRRAFDTHNLARLWGRTWREQGL